MDARHAVLVALTAVMGVSGCGDHVRSATESRKETPPASSPSCREALDDLDRAAGDPGASDDTRDTLHRMRAHLAAWLASQPPSDFTPGCSTITIPTRP